MATLVMGVFQVFEVLWRRGGKCDSGGARCLDAGRVLQAVSLSVKSCLSLSRPQLQRRVKAMVTAVSMLWCRCVVVGKMEVVGDVYAETRERQTRPQFEFALDRLRKHLGKVCLRISTCERRRISYPV
jgi:hypothetical protein